MQLDDIKASVRPAKRDLIDGLFVQFREECASEDLDQFVSWLHEGGHISAQTFRGLHAGGQLVLTSFETLAENTFYPDEKTQESLVRGLDTGLDDFDHEPDEEPTDPGRAPRFQFLGKLAAGAMGEIHIVRERELQRKVALKRMHASIAKKPKLARRFLNEAQITAQLDHPNIVPVYSLDNAPDKPLSYTMKLVRGRTFAAVIHETQLLYEQHEEIDEDHSLLTRLDHFCRSCDGLAYSHSRGVVHRDLKPENIMVGAYGEVYVMDWGIARIMESTEDIDDELVDVGGTSIQKTRFGAVLGTPAYMSPEQAAGQNEKLDGRSDGFSLGLILYELVCLRPAVSGSDTMQILDRMQVADIDPLQHYSAGESVPPPLAAIIRKATQRRPEDRYQSVKELAEDVRRFMRGEPVTALREGFTQRMYRFISRHREIALVSVLVAFTIFGVVTIGSLGSTLFTVRSASVREGQLARLLSGVSRQGHSIDTKFQSYEGLLKVVTSSTADALLRDPETLGPDATAFFVKDSPPIGLAPEFYETYVSSFHPDDLGPAPVYGKGVELSLAFPNTHVARGLNPIESTLIASKLALLRGPLRRVLLESHEAGMITLDQAEAERILRTDISPVQWVYVGLESGVGVTYPGHDGITPGIDVRKEPWYHAGAGKYEAVWGNPHLDASGNNTLLPVSMGIYSDSGEFIGVASLEVSFEYIRDNLLSMEEFDGVADAFILDEQGKVLLSTRQQAERSTSSALRSRWMRRKRFENEDVRRAVAEREGGHLEVEGPEGGTDLVVWSRMGDMGWTYLVQGPRHILMD